MFLQAKDKLDNWTAEWFTPEEILRESELFNFVMNDKLKDTLDIVDKLRVYIDEPLIITDACRFSGSKTSQHFFLAPFNALDIYAKNYSGIELMKIVEELDLGTGRGLYPYSNSGFIHLDTRRGKSSKAGRISRWWRDDENNYHTWNKDYQDKVFDGWLEK